MGGAVGVEHHDEVPGGGGEPAGQRVALAGAGLADHLRAGQHPVRGLGRAVDRVAVDHDDLVDRRAHGGERGQHDLEVARLVAGGHHHRHPRLRGPPSARPAHSAAPARTSLATRRPAARSSVRSAGGGAVVAAARRGRQRAERREVQGHQGDLRAEPALRGFVRRGQQRLELREVLAHLQPGGELADRRLALLHEPRQVGLRPAQHLGVALQGRPPGVRASAAAAPSRRSARRAGRGSPPAGSRGCPLWSGSGSRRPPS